jgi:hypothetical protein
VLSYSLFRVGIVTPYNLAWKLFPFREPLTLKEAQPLWFSLEETGSLWEMLVILAVYSQGMVRYSDFFLTKCLGRRHLIVQPFVIINAFSGWLKVLLSIYPKAMDLSIDHIPILPDELRRIQNAGGRVISVSPFRCAVQTRVELGWYHVNGNLAMSRSIGTILS